MAFKDLLKLLDLKAPERLYFDHLYSEYQALRPIINSPEDEKLIAEIVGRRKDSNLTWNDIYSFELVVSKYLSVDSLHDKILRLRSDYLGVAGQDEFNDYRASNPPDVSRPPNPLPDNYRDILQADIQYLLDRLYLQYGMLPVREARLKRLSFGVGLFCTSFLLVIVILIILVVIGQRVETGSENASNDRPTPQATSSPQIEQSVEAKQHLQIPALPIFVAIIAGAMGGLISSLQRIQKPNADGNSIYNLSVLFNASYSIFLSPLTGAVFAVLLYMMFTGKILEGRFFPEIYTPSQASVRAPTPDVTASPLPNESTAPGVNANSNEQQTPSPQMPLRQPSTKNSATVVATTSPRPTTSPPSSVTPTPSVSPVGSPSATPTPLLSPKSSARQSVSIRDFLVESGPAWGEDYALMIIWCFIAGFAERFVPDALDRLITGKS